jgi:trafficking protein particle complex subunit 6
LDYLLIELTNTLKHSAAVANKRLKEREAELIKAGLLAPPLPRKDHPGVRDSMNSTTSSTSNRNNNAKPLDEAEEAVRFRLENIGMAVGGNLAERYEQYSIQAGFSDFEMLIESCIG